MYRLGLWFVLGLRLQINLIYEFIYIYIYIWALNIIYMAANPKQYTDIDRYPKYIVPLAKPVQPLVRY